MSIATKCTCGHSLTGVCTSSVKECNQLINMENKCPSCHSTNIRNDSIRNNNGIIGPGCRSWVVEEKYSCNDCGVYFKPVTEKDIAEQDRKDGKELSAHYAHIEACEKKEAVAFVNWTLSSGCDTYTCTDEDQWTNIYTQENITTAELYDIFKQQKEK